MAGLKALNDREIQMSKSAKLFFSDFIVGAGRFFGRMKITVKMSFATILNANFPYSTFLTEPYSLKSGTAVFPWFTIKAILGMGTLTKILATIVERISVFMVAFFPWFTFKNLTMHGDRSMSSNGPSNVKTFGAIRPYRIPIPLREPLKVSSINNGILALRKSNKTIGWVRRLSNKVSLHPAFWHGLTSSKVLQLSRYSIIFFLLLFCSTIGTNGQAIVALSPVPAQQFFSSTGAPLASGCIYTTISGTATPLATYNDGTGLVINSNPIILDAGGFGNIWLTNASYRFTIYSKGVGGVIGTDCFNGVLQRTVDAVSAWSVINQPANLFLSCASSDPSGSAGELGCRSDLGNKGRYFSTLWDSIVTENSTATLANKTISNGAYSGAQTGFIGTSPVLNNPNVNGTVITGPPATYLIMANDVVTGTTLNKLAKINPAGLAGFAILPAPTDTSGFVGIVVAGAGATGNATIQQSGSASCVFDNAVTSGDYVQVSSVGGCHDTGIAAPNYPTSGDVVGRLLATNAAPGTYLIDLFSPGIKAGNQGAAIGCTNFTPATITNNNTVQTLLSCPIPANTLAQGNMLQVDITGIESTASAGTISIFVTLGGGTFCSTTSAPAGVANNHPWNFVGKFSTLTAGAGGTGNWSCQYFSSSVGGGGIAGPNGVVGAPTIAVNTTISNTLLIQVQMSVANAGNSVTGQLLKAVIF